MKVSKKVSKFLRVVLLVAVIVIIPMIAVQAAPLHAPVRQEAVPTVPGLSDLLVTLKNLGGLALFFSAAFNAAKSAGWMKNDQAPAANLIFNTIALVGLVVLQIAGKTNAVPVIDESAGILATIISSVFALFYQLWVTRAGHQQVLAGLPVFGTSFSGRSAGESVSVLEQN